MPAIERRWRGREEFTEFREKFTEGGAATGLPESDNRVATPNTCTVWHDVHLRRAPIGGIGI